MRDNDIIEKIHKIYDQKEPDVLSRLDFSKVEMKTAPQKSLNKRYISAAAVYAAACLVIVIALPFIIGGGVDEPKPAPSNSVVSSETDVTEDERTVPGVWLYLSQNYDPFYEENEIAGGTADEEEKFRTLYESNVSETEFGKIKSLKAVTPQEVRSNTSYRLFEVNDHPTTYLMYEETIVRLYSDGIKRLAVADANSDGKYELYFYGGTSSGFGRPMLWFDPVSKKVESVTVDYDGEIEISFRNYIFDLPENGKLRARITNPRHVMPGGKVYCGEFTDNGVGEAVFKITEVRDATQDDLTLWQKEMGITETSPEDTEVSGTTIAEETAVPGTTITEETAVPGTTASEVAASNDVYPIPEETSFETKEPTPETVAPEPPIPETEKMPSAAEPAVSTSKTPVETEPTVTTSSEAVTAPVTTAPEKETNTPTFINPPAESDPKATTASTLRFYKDSGHTEEYESAADIPYGTVAYYEVVSDPGYLCTRVKMNVYEITRASRPHDFLQYSNCFVNTYSGDSLEYSTYSVLAGDMDMNLVYNLRDVVVLLKFLANEYGVAGVEGTWGDYNCDGRVNLTDVVGILKEIAKWDIDRNNPCPNTFELQYLLPIDKAEVLTHGVHPNVVLTDGAGYSVHRSVNSLSDMVAAIKNNYDDTFFEVYDLVVIYCFTPEGNQPELTELWYNTANGYVSPVFAGKDTSSFSKYAVCVPVEKSLGVTENYPR